MSVNQDELLPYYKKELTYLRRMGRAFAEKYPKLAGRLELGAQESADPHVERLIESFAFLTGRIQHRLDSQFPEITTALLGVLYPHLVDPIPPLTVAHFEVDPDQGKLSTGHLIDKHTKLFAQTPEGLTCRFRTCYPVTLWPLELISAGFESKAQFDFLDHIPEVAAVLRLRLVGRGTPLRELELKKLRFYLSGSHTLVDSLYELLFGHVYRVAVLPENAAAPVYLPEPAIRPVGFAPSEEVISYPSHAQPAYRLLQEYFIFPAKFHFFDLDHLELSRCDRVLDILILLRQAPPDKLPVEQGSFCLGCTPVANLFPKTTEPIRLDQRTTEYRLVPDMRRERTMEIHSIESVSASSNPAEKSQELKPFYSFRHRWNGQDHRAFWHARRLPSDRSDLPGTEVRLSFVDLDFKPSLPPEQTVFAHTLCTNRDLATQLPAGALLQTEEKAPLHRIHCFGKPTPPAYPPLGGAGLWALISSLSLSYLSLSGGEHGLDALKEILRLYGAGDRPSTRQQIEGIRAMTCRRTVRRMGNEAWRGFCQGTEITLVFDESLYVGSGAFLLGSVLHRFFALSASTNSFTQLIMRKEGEEEVWKRWPPLAGEQELL
jgi:type VI secretion system protein ImpG